MKMAPRVDRGAIVYLNRIRRSELHSDTGLVARFRTAVGAGDGAADDDVTDTEFSVVIKTELVLPVTVGHPGGHELSVLRTPERLGGVEGQTDRFAVQLGLGRGAVYTGARIGRKAVGIALRSIPAGAAADGEVVDAFGQEAEIHVVVDFNRPGRFELGISINAAVDTRRCTNSSKVPALIKCVMVEFLVGQGRDVKVALVGKIEGELQTGFEG